MPLPQGGIWQLFFLELLACPKDISCLTDVPASSGKVSDSMILADFYVLPWCFIVFSLLAQ